ncbi:hypothetical protein [Methylobacterium sp. E-045]|uniref:hypothetical protein n=1 Tax=Methylobacterium sp. E-045 TaxID=2836575 RepID=UPI001FBBAE15|nr:hypothetical protein [Methylobacterium sp. E-045]MCJ2129727.1 hypothetical protein [Methylobacterium sp. E-045]
MATFVGSNAEFHHFIGPRIRNAVNLFARKGRLSRKGVCEHCNQPNLVLDSAHVTGRGRRHFIDQVLARYTSAGTVRCLMEDVEKEIILAHGDATDAFKFLCKPCHREYDKNTDNYPVNVPASNQAITPHQSDNYRLKLKFNPSNEVDFLAALIEHKTARITMTMQDGSVDTRIWHAGNFGPTSNLRGNLSSGYFRNWRDRGIVEGLIEIVYPR